MGKYIAKRLLLLIPTTLLVCVIIFALQSIHSVTGQHA